MPEETANDELRDLEIERLKLLKEKESLELIKLRKEVEKMKLEDRQRDILLKQHAETVDEYRRRINMEQHSCNHHKGGVDIAGVRGQGTHNLFSIVKHQLPTGDIMVLCQRCSKIWQPGDENYYAMLNAPTDNTMSTSVQFIGAKRTDVHIFQDGSNSNQAS